MRGHLVIRYKAIIIFIAVLFLQITLRVELACPVSLDQATREVDRMGNKPRDIEKIIRTIPKKPTIEEEEKAEGQNAGEEADENAKEVTTEETVNIDDIK